MAFVTSSHLNIWKVFCRKGFVVEQSIPQQCILRTSQNQNTKESKRIVTAVKKQRKKEGKSTNFTGSFMSYYMQEWERRILEIVYTMMCENGYIYDDHCVLCYDGIMILRDRLGDISIEQLLLKCKSVVKEKTGLDLNFTEKKMKKSLLPQIEQKEKEQAEWAFPFEW